MDACLDERALATGGQVLATWLTSASDVVDLVEDVLGVGQVYATSDIWETEIPGLGTLSLAVASDPARTRDLSLRLVRAIARSELFDPAQGTVQEVNESITLGHGIVHCTRFQAAALVSHRDRVIQVYPSRWDDAVHYALRGGEEWMTYLRRWLEVVRPTNDVFRRVAEHAYPSLYLHDELNLNAFGMGDDELWPLLVRHLAFLNDVFLNIDREANHNPGDITARAAAIANIEVTPESHNTRANAQAIAERDVRVGGHTVRCEWHTKFYWDRGRIHFHPGTNQSEAIRSITGGRLIVGIFAHHLTT